jgi:hypothetical protein
MNMWGAAPRALLESQPPGRRNSLTSALRHRSQAPHETLLQTATETLKRRGPTKLVKRRGYLRKRKAIDIESWQALAPACLYNSVFDGSLLPDSALLLNVQADQVGLEEGSFKSQPGVF